MKERYYMKCFGGNLLCCVKQIKSDQKGFGLVEILITLFVLGIGLLGVATLQTKGFQASQTSYYRTLAVFNANEMADRIRANTTGIASGAYNDMSGFPTSYTDCSQSVCTTAQLAEFDRYEWNTQLADLLPSGQGSVSGSGTGSTFTISVMWDESRGGATGTGCDPSDADDMRCIQLDVRL